MANKKSNIHIYTAQTPNGIKIPMLLEELGLKYEVTAISIQKNTQKEPWFLDINPNGRIPAMTDVLEDGQTINLFESGSIMQYLVDQYDPDHKVSYPRGSREYYETNNWLFWQMGGLGPMQGQSNHFFRYAPEKIKYGIERYQNETRRLYGIMDKQLAKTKAFLVADKLTIADLSCWGWVAAHHWAGVEIDEFPNLEKWMDKILARPACERGRHVPSRHTTLDYKHKSKEELAREAEESATATRKWIMQAMSDDAKKKDK